MKKAREKDWSDFLGVKETDSVADLGAGGGHILATLNVRKRIAVEVNDAARLSIQESYPGKIESYQYPEDVPNDSIDILFSTSALEHFECPLTELREMSKKVKHGGRVVSGLIFNTHLIWESDLTGL